MIDEKPTTIPQTVKDRKSGLGRIILLYASAGAGHRSACSAVMQSIKDLKPEADVLMVDILKYMPKVIARIYSGGYILVVGSYPMLWYFIYESGSDLSRFKLPGFWHRIFWQTILKSLFKFLDKEKPAQIISSHFLSSWAAGLYKRKYDVTCRVSTIITDYGIHPVWIAPGQDFVFVATEQLRSELMPFAHYLGTDKIIPMGIPIHPQFGRRADVRALKRKYQLDPDRHTILILGGMFGSRNLRDILYWLRECQGALELILVAGRHYPISESIKELLIEHDVKYQFFGYIDFMNELMAISDLAITKAGALTTSECLASGLPLVIFKPYPGQEVRNCDYFLEQGVAVRVDQLSGLCHKVDGILNEPGRLEKMRTRAREVARPYSSEKIARILLDLPE
jgi:processive 1,2-diacylglycerol beta-glucosyltransferase